MKIKTARIGSTLHVFDDTTEAVVKAGNILPDGDAAFYADRSAEWIIDEVIVDATKSGSAQFIWDKSGNRVKHERCRYRKDAGGSVSRTVEGTVFKVI